LFHQSFSTTKFYIVKMVGFYCKGKLPKRTFRET
jgi:hypothetical protein